MQQYKILLVIDIGNTNIAIGLFRKDNLQKSWRIGTNVNRTADEYSETILNFLKRDNLLAEKIDFCLIATVVPQLTQVFTQVFTSIIKTDFCFLKLEQIPMKDNLYNRNELGVDRMVNAFAGFQKYQQALVVIDFGTATTFDVVSKEGNYSGGIIMPGIKLAYDALSQKTAKLPKVDFEVPKKAIGKNTIESMHSGMFFGYLGMIESCIKEIFKEQKGISNVIATGGDLILLKNCPYITKIEPELTLWGLYLLSSKLK